MNSELAEGEFIKLHEPSINGNFTGSLKRFLKPTISIMTKGWDKSHPFVMVEVAGLELAASSTRNWRATTCATPRNCDIIAQFLSFVKGICEKSSPTEETVNSQSKCNSAIWSYIYSENLRDRGNNCP